MYKNTIKYNIRESICNSLGLHSRIFNKFQGKFICTVLKFVSHYSTFYFDTIISMSETSLFLVNSFLALWNPPGCHRNSYPASFCNPLKLTSQKSVHRIVLHSWNSTIVSRALYSLFRLLPVASFFRLPTATCLAAAPLLHRSLLYFHLHVAKPNYPGNERRENDCTSRTRTINEVNLKGVEFGKRWPARLRRDQIRFHLSADEHSACRTFVAKRLLCDLPTVPHAFTNILKAFK